MRGAFPDENPAARAGAKTCTESSRAPYRRGGRKQSRHPCRAQPRHLIAWEHHYEVYFRTPRKTPAAKWPARFAATLAARYTLVTGRRHPDQEGERGANLLGETKPRERRTPSAARASHPTGRTAQPRRAGALHYDYLNFPDRENITCRKANITARAISLRRSEKSLRRETSPRGQSYGGGATPPRGTQPRLPIAGKK